MSMGYRKKQAAAEEPVEIAEQAEYYEAPRKAAGKFSKKMLMAVVAVVVIVVVAATATFALTSKSSASTNGNKKGPGALTMVQKSGSAQYTGAQVPVRQTFEQPIDFKAALANSSGSGNVTNINKVNMQCSWTDDLSGSEPDEMYFELIAPDGTNKSADTEGTSGACTLTIQYANMTEKAINDNSQGWKLKVTCVVAGHKDKGPFGRIVTPDNGNNWAAKLDFTYFGVDSTAK
jgi:outer membrane scaffolding protein for murein synthesis (MipA/OmpV family)